MDRIHFSTPEDVDLGYELAGPASRLGAYILDRLILLIVQIALLVTATVVVNVMDGSFEDIGGLFGFVGIVLVGFGELLYFGLWEWRSGGLTPGKRRVGLRVVMDGGYGLTTTAIILRSILRAVDMIPFFWIVPALDKKHRRLGDFVGGTLVMRLVDESNTRVPMPDIKYSQLPVHHLALGAGELAKLRRSEYASLEEFLLRAPGLPALQQDDLAGQILGSLLRRLNLVQPPGVQSIELLEELYLAMRTHSAVLAD
ncbi:MAG: putative RDD family membrane protein YckC [Planctomycetota bacterium]|jgi:uncharacterized RDD family membrane protein YckC